MFSQAKYIPLSDKQGPVFSGGIIDNSPPNTIPYKNTPYARNFRLSGYGTAIRPWFTQFGNTIWGTGIAPTWMGAYLRADPTTDRIVVAYQYSGSSGLTTINPTTGAEVQINTSTNLVSTNVTNFACTNDSLYVMNWSDPYGKLNGTTYTNPSTGISNFSPAFGVWFNNSLWCSGDPKAPSTLYKSASNNPESFTGTGNDIFNSLYPITGLGCNAQTLYVFSDQTIDMFNVNSIKTFGAAVVYTSVPLESSEGASNHASVVSAGNYIYFLTRSNKIKRVAQGSGQIYDVQELSHRMYKGINKTMATLDPDQSKSFGYVVPDKQIIKWHVKTIGATYNDLCIVYHYEYDEFMVDTQKIFSAGVWYKSKAFTSSALEQKVYRDEYGTDDDWAPIQFEYRLRVLDYWDPTMNKELWQQRTFLELNTSTVMTQYIYAQGGLIDTATIDKNDIPIVEGGIGTQQIGTFAIGEEWNPWDILYDASIVREKWDLQVRAKNFEVVYKCASLGANFLLKQTEQKIQMLDQLTTSTTR